MTQIHSRSPNHLHPSLYPWVALEAPRNTFRAAEGRDDPLIVGHESVELARKSASRGSGMIGVVWTGSTDYRGILELLPKFLGEMSAERPLSPFIWMDLA